MRERVARESRLGRQDLSFGCLKQKHNNWIKYKAWPCSFWDHPFSANMMKQFINNKNKKVNNFKKSRQPKMEQPIWLSNVAENLIISLTNKFSIICLKNSSIFKREPRLLHSGQKSIAKKIIRRLRCVSHSGRLSDLFWWVEEFAGKLALLH